MTWFQPSPPAAPPAVPSPAELARLQAENAALTTQLTNQALREGVAATGGKPGQAGGPPPAMGVLRGENGVIIVMGRDGRMLQIDPKVVNDPDQVQHLVETALEPPRVPEPRSDSRYAVPVVAIVFTFLFLIALVISRTVQARARGGGAPRGESPELAARLGRIEQAIEAVAIEVERISESERYSARLLTERLPERAPASAAPTADVVR